MPVGNNSPFAAETLEEIEKGDQRITNWSNSDDWIRSLVGPMAITATSTLSAD